MPTDCNKTSNPNNCTLGVSGKASGSGSSAEDPCVKVSDDCACYDLANDFRTVQVASYSFCDCGKYVIGKKGDTGSPNAFSGGDLTTGPPYLTDKFVFRFERKADCGIVIDLTNVTANLKERWDDLVKAKAGLGEVDPATEFQSPEYEFANSSRYPVYVQTGCKKEDRSIEGVAHQIGVRPGETVFLNYAPVSAFFTVRSILN